MKFAQYILKHVIPEWGFMYLNYVALKKYLSVCGAIRHFLLVAKRTKSPQEYLLIKKQVLQQTYLMSKVESDNKEFTANIKTQVEKVQAFIKWKHYDLRGKTYRISLQVQTMKKNQVDIDEMHAKYDLYKKRLKKDKIYDNVFLQEQIECEQLKENCEEFEKNKSKLLQTCFKLYNECVHFEKYMNVNFDAIRKLQKKYSKKMLKVVRQKTKDQIQQVKKSVDEIQISRLIVKVKQLQFQIEKILISNFFKKNPKQCREILRKYSMKMENKQKTWFLFGMYTGFCLMFIIILIFIGFDSQVQNIAKELYYLFFPTCRGVMLFMIYYWFLAILVWQWNKQKINYKQIFEFNHHFSTLNDILKRVMILTSFFLLILLLYVGELADLGKFMQDIEIFSPNYLPIILWLTWILFLFFPSKIELNGEGRIWLYNTFLHTFKLTNFAKKEFSLKHIFISQQLTSLIIPFTDFNYTVCLYINGMQNLQDENQNQCFTQSRQVTLILAIIPFIMLLYQIFSIMIKQSSLSHRIILDFCLYALSIVIIITSILAHKIDYLIFPWIVLACCNVALLMFIEHIDLQYLKLTVNKPLSFSNQFTFHGYKRQKFLFGFYFFLALNQPISISTILLGKIFSDEHSYIILFVGTIELIRRLFVNFFTIDQEHCKNLKNYSTVGNYIYPFKEDSTKFRNTLVQQEDDDTSSLYSRPGTDIEEKKEAQPLIQLTRFSIDQRKELAIQNVSDSLQTQQQSNLFKSTKKVMNLTEIVSKESEQFIGESFLNFDLDSYSKEEKIDRLDRFAKYVPTDDDIRQVQRVKDTNQLYKKEIEYLNQKFQVKKIKIE